MIVEATDEGNPALATNVTVNIERTNETDFTLQPDKLQLFIGMSAGSQLPFRIIKTNMNYVNVTGMCIYDLKLICLKTYGYNISFYLNVYNNFDHLLSLIKT